MISPERIGSAFMPIITVMAFMFLVTFVYGLLSRDRFEDDTITITYKCSNVLSAEEQYPLYVVQQCRKLRSK